MLRSERLPGWSFSATIGFRRSSIVIWMGPWCLGRGGDFVVWWCGGAFFLELNSQTWRRHPFCRLLLIPALDYLSQDLCRVKPNRRIAIFLEQLAVSGGHQ